MSAPRQTSTRLLAPAALAVFAVVFLIVVIASLGGDDKSSAPERPIATSTRDRDAAARRRARRRAERNAPISGNPRFYRVRAGDNLALIAERTGISLEELRALNPTLDPQGLVTGQRIRLRASGATGATGATGGQGATGSGGAE
jgi:hypothetical protein